MKTKYLLLVAPMALVSVAPAHAAVTWGDQTVNNGSVLDNVLLNNNQTGNTVYGTTNNGAVTVAFTSPETLVTSANGQAVITALDGALNSLTFSLTNALGFSNFEFDLQDSLSKTQSITVTSNLGSHTYTSFDSPGANWAGAAAPGQYFTSVTWTASAGGYDDMKQLRLGGIVGAVPEASTWAMMLLGLGGIAWSLRRKHRVSTSAQIRFA